MQLLVKNSDVKLIQTQAISAQSPLRDGIITGYLLCKYHELVSFNSLRTGTGKEVMCHVIVRGSMY